MTQTESLVPTLIENEAMLSYRKVGESIEWCQLTVSDDEFVAASNVHNRISLYWTTNQTMVEAIGNCLPDDLEGVRALVGHVDDDESFDISADEIVEFLGNHWVGQVMIYKMGFADQVIYTTHETGPSEVCATSSGFNPDTNELFLDVGSVLRSTTTPELQQKTSYILQNLLPRVDESLQINSN